MSRSQPNPNQPHLTDDIQTGIPDSPFIFADLLANDRLIPAHNANFTSGLIRTLLH